MLFGLLITGIGTLILLYATQYMRGHPNIRIFFVYMFLFEFIMLGIVLADNLIALYVFWEGTTIFSYFLIGFNHEDTQSRRNALQALLITGSGGLAMLGGFVLLGIVGGSFEITELVQKAQLIRDNPMYLTILILVLLGAFTKSAQFPFHFWLPNAMVAPTPVSAFLHSATMVKAGVFMLARLHPVLGHTSYWSSILIFFGAFTAVYASILALRQYDLKIVMAYTTVMGLGTITIFLGMDSELGIQAACLFVLTHALYKATFFLVVGIIDHSTGTRDMRQLGGLLPYLPWVSAAAILAALSMSGVPPFVGFLAKETMYSSALNSHFAPIVIIAAGLIANALMVSIAMIAVLKPFGGSFPSKLTHPHKVNFLFYVSPLILGVLGLLLGIFTKFTDLTLITPSTQAIIQKEVGEHIHLWHGFNLPLALSAITLLLGISIYRFSDALRTFLIDIEKRLPSADKLWDSFIQGMLNFATAQTKFFQCGSLRIYLFVVFSAVAVLLGHVLITQNLLTWPQHLSPIRFYQWALLMLIAAAIITGLRSTNKLTIICALGVLDAAVAIVYLVLGAPDLAKTQFLVGALQVAIIVLVLLKLPRFRVFANDFQVFGIMRTFVSILFGVVFSALSFAVLNVPFDSTLTNFFEMNSVPQGMGHNIVNVILVDFRGLDTLG